MPKFNKRGFLKYLGQSHKLNVITAVTRECVLKCTYCFATDPNKKFAIVSDDLLEKIIGGAFDTGRKKIQFEWTGGEALLGGRIFYEKVLKYQRKYKQRGVVFSNSVQTSGVVYNENLYDFLVKKGFSISLTIDGPPDLHNANRPVKNGAPSFDKVLKSLNYLKKIQGYCGAIATVTKKSIGREKETFNYLRSIGVKGFHSNHYVYDSNKPIKSSEDAIDSDDYYNFFSEQLKSYIECDDTSFNLRQIRYFMQSLMGIECAALCSFCGRCLTNFIHIDSEGNAAICGRFVGYDEHVLGNINDAPIKSLLSPKNSRMNRYIGERMSCINKCEKEKCKFIRTCQYGCPYMSFISDNSSISKKDYLCAGKKKVIGRVDDLLQSYGVKTYTQFKKNVSYNTNH